MNKNSLVSVIIPCYNAEKFVEQAVRSIMEQTYSNLEIICINDCSVDNTGIILQKLACEDSRIVYIENEFNLKLPKTLNKGILLAKGNYIARMDADDIALPERIHKQMQFMLSHQDIDILGTNVYTIDDNGNLLDYISNMLNEHESIVNKLAWKTGLLHPTILAKKSFFDDLNGFNANLSYAEDYELWIRGWLAGKKFANLKDVLLKYRIHESQMSGITYNSHNAKIVQNFLYNFYKQTGNMKFLFGWIVQTRIMYCLVRKTSSFRRKFFKK